jgi:seryl-tRNA synthetase
MLDIRFIRDNPELVKAKSKQKGYEVDVDQLLEADKKRRELLAQVEDLRSKRNELATIQKNGNKPSPEQIQLGKELKTQLAEQENKLEQLEQTYLSLLKIVPNMPLDNVPIGETEAQNVVIKTVGDKPNFNFKPKSHVQIAEAKGWLDKERAVKIAGSRFVYLKGDIVRLEMALWNYGLDVLGNQEILKQIIADNNLDVSDKPFTPVLPPAVAKKSVFEATGRLNKEEQTYKVEDEDLWLNASAEHTIAPMYLNEVLDEKELPIRYVGYTTAFRKEAGTYGKDTEGIIRLHQFNKLEAESFTSARSSLEEHKFLVAIQEYLMAQLKIPYHVLEKCTADIGRPNAKGVDIEAWIPSQQAYRETHTADYLTDYQTRAMKTRVRSAGGGIEFAHTNDATVFSQRPLIAIIENNQTSNGNVVVPEVLRPYIGGKEEI